MSVPVLFKINNKHLIEIMLSSTELAYYETKAGISFAYWTDEQILQYSIESGVQPTDVKLTSEQYSRDIERTANYVLSDVTIVNCKSKPEFTWSMIKASYVQKLLDECGYHYGYEVDGEVSPEIADVIKVTYWDFTGVRTIDAYLGQTIEGTLIQYEQYATSTYESATGWTKNTDAVHQGKTLYWENFRVAFPER